MTNLPRLDHEELLALCGDDAELAHDYMDSASIGYELHAIPAPVLDLLNRTYWTDSDIDDMAANYIDPEDDDDDDAEANNPHHHH